MASNPSVCWRPPTAGGAAACVGAAVVPRGYPPVVPPVLGRGGFGGKLQVPRPGPPIHEVMRPAEPNVIAAGAELVRRLLALDAELARKRDPMAGPESLFIGQIRSGEIFNQYPHACTLEGTRRWLPGTRYADADAQFRQV